MINNVRIVGTGVATLDLYLNKDRMYPGGNEINVVCHARRVGAEAGFLGAWGHDRAGDILEEALEREGVDISMCQELDGSSGYCLVRIEDDGERVFLGWNEDSVIDHNPIEFDEAQMEYVKSFDILYAGMYSTLAPEKMAFLKAEGVDLCYDFNSVFTDEDVEAIAPSVRYAFFSCSHLNEEEIKDLLVKASKLGAQMCVATRGADPVLVYDGEKFHSKETKRVEAVDTLGAGDSFAAAVMSWYLSSIKDGKTRDEAIELALDKATEYSAGVVQIEGSLGYGYDLDADRLSELVDLDDESQDMRLRNSNIIYLHDVDVPELDLYVGNKEVHLLRYFEPEPGIFIAESPGVTRIALEQGYEPLSVVCSERMLNDPIIDMVGDVPVYVVDPDKAKKHFGYMLTGGLCCAMRRKSNLDYREVIKDATRIVVLEDVENPTNVGAIFRSAAALGMDAVILSPACVDPLYRRSIRVSTGNIFLVPWAFMCYSEADWKEKGIALLKDEGFTTVAMALREDNVNIDDPRLKKEEKLAIIMGNEGEGLAASTIEACDHVAKIPMMNGVDSLNVAVASGIAIWELGKRNFS